LKKQTLQILLIMLLCANLFTIYGTSAQDPPLLKTEPQSYIAPASYVNETFKINVTINNVQASQKLIGVHFRLSFNNSLLEVLNVAEGPFLSMFNQTSALPYTFFVSYVEKDGMFKRPHVLVGTMLLPKGPGDWPGPFPEGNGTIATITFKAIKQTVEPEPSAKCTLEFIEVKLISVLNEKLRYNTTSGFYQIPPLLYPVPAFIYEPTMLSVGEIVLFNASESYDPDYEISVYSWDFGDRTIINATEPVIAHVYGQQGTFNVTLTVTDIDGLSANITKTISIGYYKELTVGIDVGSIHFAGESADVYILTSDFGRRIDATSIRALLYYNGSLFANLTNLTQHVSTGLYRIAYQIPAYAMSGTYTLVVEAECYSIKGTNLKSFLVSLTLTEISAKLVDIEGNIGIINSTLGTLRIDIGKLNATITSINGNVVTISTTLGDVIVKLGDVQSMATTTLYATSILSAIAVILALAILIFMRKIIFLRKK